MTLDSCLVLWNRQVRWFSSAGINCLNNACSNEHRWHLSIPTGTILLLFSEGLLQEQRKITRIRHDVILPIGLMIMTLLLFTLIYLFEHLWRSAVLPTNRLFVVFCAGPFVGASRSFIFFVGQSVCQWCLQPASWRSQRLHTLLVP